MQLASQNPPRGDEAVRFGSALGKKGGRCDYPGVHKSTASENRIRNLTSHGSLKQRRKLSNRAVYSVSPK